MIEDKDTKISSVAGRIVIDVMTLVLIILTPWWLYFGVILFFMFYFYPYYEVVLLAIFMDALYGSPSSLNFPMFFTLISIILLTASGFLGKRIYK